MTDETHKSWKMFESSDIESSPWKYAFLRFLCDATEKGSNLAVLQDYFADAFRDYRTFDLGALDGE